jgi:Calcineurin-like phosphoesterase
MQKKILLLFSFITFFHFAFSQANKNIVQFIFTSDVHFGLTKNKFRNKENASAAEVNLAMVNAMNGLPDSTLPFDKGVNAGHRINFIDAVAITGDIANRQEKGIQSATASWHEFAIDYMQNLHVMNAKHQPAALLITPGNHDISNAVGFHRAMEPLTDVTSLFNIYDLEMKSSKLLSKQTFNAATDRVHYSRDFNGVHFVFVQAWPDSSERKWMENDLSNISVTTPVIVFTHSYPDVEARFFTNPNGNHSINENDKFENLVPEVFKDGVSVEDKAMIEQKAFVAFIQQHPQIKAYFHGHTNYTEYYDWKGPEQNINLHCFRADSPMKGKYSAKDETKLAFELVSIDTEKKLMTVRECLWNVPSAKGYHLQWGQTATIALQ